MSSMLVSRKENDSMIERFGYGNINTRPDTDPLNQLELELITLRMDEV
jgi:hypothetical protein